MKRNQKGFGIIEILLVITALTLVVGVGFYVVSTTNKNKGSTKDAISKITDKAASPQKTTTASPKTSDTELIIAAVKADDQTDGNAMITGSSTIKVESIQDSNAKGSVFTPDDGSDAASGGYEFIAHKSGSDWKVVFKGQEAPGKAIGEQYKLPADWYDASY